MVDRYVARRIHRNYTVVPGFRAYFSRVIFSRRATNNGELEIIFEIPSVEARILMECGRRK